MTFIYTWTNTEQTMLKREGNGHVDFVPVAEENRDYQEFLVSGITPEPYVAPAPAAPATAAEKLAAAGLTVDELKALLAS